MHPLGGRPSQWELPKVEEVVAISSKSMVSRYASDFSRANAGRSMLTEQLDHVPVPPPLLVSARVIFANPRRMARPPARNRMPTNTRRLVTRVAKAKVTRAKVAKAKATR